MNRPISTSKPNILIAPLDWGLGHATRCIPIIKCLLEQPCNVVLAGEGKIKTLLQGEFPELRFLPLQGYRVRYSHNHWALPFTIASQIPRILSSIKMEQLWLQEVLEKQAIDAVISDNRFGLHHPAVPSVFITHQLRIKTPLGKMAEDFLQQLNYRYIDQFSECWVPDAAGENNLGGALSHPNRLPSVPVNYIGPLSRFTKAEAQNTQHLLVLLSGPEPQRTLLERLLLEQLNHYTGPVVLVRGLPGSREDLAAPAHITVYNHLAAEELQQTISEASFIISRCGYSTVMDLAALQKKSILIPTPGQSEQEYLGRHLMERKLALCIEQKRFNLKAALDAAAAFDYQLPNFYHSTKLTDTIQHFVEQLKLKKTHPVNPLTNPANPRS
jgi:uncharacterized protein (TIGR00661 family)